MKETFKNNIKVTLISISAIVIVVAGFLINIFYGNPISKNIAAKQIKIYLEDTYGVNEYIVSTPKYDIETMAYHTFVMSQTSEDTQFEVSYGGNKIVDTYSTFVASKRNTWTRLHAEFNNIATEVFEKQYMADIFIAGLGRHHTQADIDGLTLDEPLNLESLPLDSFGVIYLKSEDISWENLAKTLKEIDAYLRSENINIDIYDIGLEATGAAQDSSSIGVYDFSKELIEQENLPQIMQEHYNEWVKSQKTD